MLCNMRYDDMIYDVVRRRSKHLNKSEAVLTAMISSRQLITLVNSGGPRCHTHLI